MKEETTNAIVELVEHIQEKEYHVSSVEANEWLNGTGFDPDSVMRTEVELTVMIPGDDKEDDSGSRFRVK